MSVSLWAYTERCEGQPCCGDCDQCATVEVNVFDEEEVHENCTVVIWRNSVTGEESIGWYENEREGGGS